MVACVQIVALILTLVDFKRVTHGKMCLDFMFLTLRVESWSFRLRFQFGVDISFYNFLMAFASNLMTQISFRFKTVPNYHNRI